MIAGPDARNGGAPLGVPFDLPNANHQDAAIFQTDAPPPPPVSEVEAVVVTAARLPPAAGDAAFAVIRLSSETLGRAQRLDEALTTVPAVSLFRRTTSLSANPTTQGISLRAIAPSGAGRTLVTLDGVPVNDPFGGWVLWSQIPTESLDGVDIVRGAGAGPYGAGALTGVIALRERDGAGALDASVGERGGLRLAGAATLPGERISLTGAAFHERSDGYVPVRGRDAGAADTPLDLDSRSASVRADVALGGDARLSLRAGAYEETRGAGLDGARSRAEGWVVGATAARAPGEGRTGWRAQVWRRDSDFANSSVSVAPDRAATTPASEQFATPAQGWGANLAIRRHDAVLGGRLEWEVGADVRAFEGETQERFRFMDGAFSRGRVAGGEAGVMGGYVDGSWASGAWLVAGGLRLDRWENTGGRRLETDLDTGAITLDAPSPDRSGEVVSARLAVHRDLGQGWTARAAAYSGFRPATLNELHRPFRVGNDITEANAALEPERLSGIEAGLGFTRPSASVVATVFANRLEDAIVNVTLGEGPATFPVAGFVPAGGVLRQRQNAGAIQAHGLEIDARIDVSDRVTLNAGLALTKAEVDGGVAAPQLTGLRPAQAPRVGAVLGLDWRASPRLTLAAQARYEGERFDDDLNSRALGSAVVLDARAEWAATDRISLYAAADNLTDAQVEVSRTAAGVAGFGPPRLFRAGLRLTY